MCNGEKSRRIWTIWMLLILCDKKHDHWRRGYGHDKREGNCRATAPAHQSRAERKVPPYQDRLNYRLTDIAAAIGTVQLKKLEKFNTRHRKNAEYYDTHLRVKGLLTPFVSPGMHHVYHQYVIRLTNEFPLSRADFIEYLKSKGIGSAVHYPLPIHHRPVYAVPNEPDSCPVSTSLAASVLVFTVHPLLDQKELAYICDVINQVK